MKKVFVILMTVVLSFAMMTACGNSTLEEEKIPTEVASSVNESNESDTSLKIDNTNVKSLFESLARYVGIVDYEKCLSVVENGNYGYESTPPSADENGKIKIMTQDGYELSMIFAPDDDGKDTLTLLSFSNGMYEGSVTDNFHTTEIEYHTYDASRQDEKNQKVYSLMEVVRFIFEEAPEKTEQYQKDSEKKEELEVELSVDHTVKDGKVYFQIHTNLPDETELMLTLKGKSYLAQDECFVKNGEADSEGFSNQGKSLSGAYTLEVSTPVPNVMDSSVTDVIGVKGERMTGEYVKKDSLTGECNVVEGEFEIDI